MKYVLPKPLSVNQLYSHNRYGSTYISRKGEDWFTMAGELIRQQRSTDKTTERPVRLDIKLFYCGRYDIDNCLKALNDLLKYPTDKSPYGMGIIKDDDQITELFIKKYKVDHRVQEKIEVEINELIG